MYNHVVDLLVGMHRRLCLYAYLDVDLFLITAVHSRPMIPYHYTGGEDSSDDGH